MNKYFPQIKENDPFSKILNMDLKGIKREDDNRGAVYLDLTNFTTMFSSLTIEPIIINNFPITRTEDREHLNSLIFTTYEGDTLSPLPTCPPPCGKLTGEYNVGARCRDCGELVLAVKDRDLEPKLWISAPEDVDTLMHPVFYQMFSNIFTRQGANIFEWMVDSSYHCEPIYEIEKIKAIPGYKRGINYFHRNFDMLFATLIGMKLPKIKPDRDALVELVKKYREHIFTRVLPIPSSLNFVNERSGGDTTYTDKTANDAIEAIRTIASLYHSVTPITPIIAERRAIKAVKQIATYYFTYTKLPLTDKLGILRKHVFGSRLFFTARGVISSYHRVHKYDECILPWGITVSMLRLHIESRLIRDGMTSHESSIFVTRHLRKYNKYIHDIIISFIESGRNGRSNFRIMLQRNPSLGRLSAQFLYVPEVNIDPRINTIYMSPLIMKAPNADIDGDELNVALALDHEMSGSFMRHHPSTGVYDLNAPRRVTNNIALPSPILSMYSRWIHERQH